MSGRQAIKEGQILTGPLFSEPMRVETVRPNGPDIWVAGLVGLHSKRVRDPARFEWNEAEKVAHYWIEVNAMTKPMVVREDSPAYRPAPQGGAGRPPYGEKLP